MSNTQTIAQSQSGRSRAYQRLTPESAVLVLIDHQSGLAEYVAQQYIRGLAADPWQRDEIFHSMRDFATEPFDNRPRGRL